MRRFWCRPAMQFVAADRPPTIAAQNFAATPPRLSIRHGALRGFLAVTDVSEIDHRIFRMPSRRRGTPCYCRWHLAQSHRSFVCYR